MVLNKMFKHGILIVLSSTIIATSTLPAFAQAEETINEFEIVNKNDEMVLTQEEIGMIMNNVPINANDPEQRNIITSIAKKVAVNALRYSGTWLEGKLAKKIGKTQAEKVSKSFYKIASYIEKVQKIQETGIASILINGGVPADVAIATAKYIVILFGL
ncbi:hypothetical protein HPK19_19560 [Arthrobacter citreus]|nr:hypothetical protein HPK19_19560 [Arthrobacter citreus]